MAAVDMFLYSLYATNTVVADWVGGPRPRQTPHSNGSEWLEW